MAVYFYSITPTCTRELSISTNKLKHDYSFVLKFLAYVFHCYLTIYVNKIAQKVEYHLKLYLDKSEKLSENIHDSI